MSEDAKNLLNYEYTKLPSPMWNNNLKTKRGFKLSYMH